MINNKELEKITEESITSEVLTAVLNKVKDSPIECELVNLLSLVVKNPNITEEIQNNIIKTTKAFSREIKTLLYPELLNKFKHCELDQYSSDLASIIKVARNPSYKLQMDVYLDIENEKDIKSIVKTTIAGITEDTYEETAHESLKELVDVSDCQRLIFDKTVEHFNLQTRNCNERYQCDLFNALIKTGKCDGYLLNAILAQTANFKIRLFRNSVYEECIKLSNDSRQQRHDIFIALKERIKKSTTSEELTMFFAVVTNLLDEFYRFWLLDAIMEKCLNEPLLKNTEQCESLIQDILGFMTKFKKTKQIALLYYITLLTDNQRLVFNKVIEFFNGEELETEHYRMLSFNRMLRTKKCDTDLLKDIFAQTANFKNTSYRDIHEEFLKVSNDPQIETKILNDDYNLKTGRNIFKAFVSKFDDKNLVTTYIKDWKQLNEEAKTGVYTELLYQNKNLNQETIRDIFIIMYDHLRDITNKCQLLNAFMENQGLDCYKKLLSQHVLYHAYKANPNKFDAFKNSLEDLKIEENDLGKVFNYIQDSSDPKLFNNLCKQPIWIDLMNKICKTIENKQDHFYTLANMIQNQNGLISKDVLQKGLESAYKCTNDFDAFKNKLVDLKIEEKFLRSVFYAIGYGEEDLLETVINKICIEMQHAQNNSNTFANMFQSQNGVGGQSIA